MNNKSRILGVCIAIGSVAPIQAQLTNVVKVTIDCKPEQPIYLVLNGNERDWILLKLADTDWVGRTPDDAPLIDPGKSVGSLRLGRSRTDCERSVPGVHDKKVAASFTFHCGQLPVRDVEIKTDPAMYVGYFRILPRDASNRRSLRCEETSSFFARQTIVDLQFSDYSLGLKGGSQRPAPEDPFENLRLQLGRTAPPEKRCGLLINDPFVIAKATLSRADVAEVLRRQKNAQRACEPPSMGTVADDINWEVLPRVKTLTMTLQPEK